MLYQNSGQVGLCVVFCGICAFGIIKSKAFYYAERGATIGNYAQNECSN